MENQEYDYIIVGSGASGCVVAEKLSRTSSCLLIEAGGSEDLPVVQDHDQWFVCLATANLRWEFPTVPQAGAGNRQLEPHMGKMLGGSSSHNAQLWVRGNYEDYDRWEKVYGLKGWNSESFLQALKTIEKTEEGDEKYHGRDGFMKVRKVEGSPLFHSFSQVCSTLNIPLRDDHWAENQLGGGLMWLNVDQNWKRHSAYRAFVQPFADRKTLSILTNTLVTKVLFEKNGDVNKAVGVECQVEGEGGGGGGGSKQSFKAKKEVILCCGAIKTPQLLMLSGIGDPAHLNSHGITPLVDLPGVGLNLQDHYMSIGFYKCKEDFPPRPEWCTWEVFGRNDGKFEEGRPDYQILFCGREQGLDGFPRLPGFEQAKDVMIASCILLHPKSRGSIRLSSSNPSEPLIINPNYLHEEEDVRTVRNCLEMARKISSRMKEFEVEILPSSSGAELDQYIRMAGASIWHPVGTCKMGNDYFSVVDSSCRVKGVQALRVIDASVMPELPSANTHAMSLALAEIASSKILSEA